jgi:hypothetical protein
VCVCVCVCLSVSLSLSLSGVLTQALISLIPGKTSPYVQLVALIDFLRLLVGDGVNSILTCFSEHENERGGVRESMLKLRLNFLDGIKLIVKATDSPRHVQAAAAARRRTFSMETRSNPLKVQRDGMILDFPFSDCLPPHISPEMCRLVLCIACNLARKPMSGQQNGFTIVLGNGAELIKDMFEKYFITDEINAFDFKIEDSSPLLFTGGTMVVVDGRTGRTFVSGVKVKHIYSDIDDSSDGNVMEHAQSKSISGQAGKCFVVQCLNGERGKHFKNLWVYFDNRQSDFKQEQVLQPLSSDGVGGHADRNRLALENINFSQFNRFKLQKEPGWYIPLLDLLVDRHFEKADGSAGPREACRIDPAAEHLFYSEALEKTLDVKLRLKAIEKIAKSAESLPTLKRILRDAATQVAVKRAVLKAVERYHANEAKVMVYETVVDILAVSIVHRLCKEESGWTFLAELFAAISAASLRLTTKYVVGKESFTELIFHFA